MATFADLGIPFPLFEAPIEDASDHVAPATCRLCGGRDRHCFELGIGDALILPCPACGAMNGLDADDRADVPCRSCGGTVPFPEGLKAKKRLLACYECLRGGKAALTKSTEFGAVSWEGAFAGVTSGEPGLRTDQFEMVPVDAEEDWYAVRIPGEHLWELLRTPDIVNWQEERWLFCCRRPMTYLGGWCSVMESLRPHDPRAFFDGIIDPDDVSVDRLWEGLESGAVCLYVYRCHSCGRHRATWDTD
jgi:uncharacterized protein CbrC (UPF0167 family)